MTALNEQIVTAYEDNNMTISEIAEDFEMDELVIKATLLQCSSLYRKASKQDSDLGFSEQEAVDMKNIIVSLARYAEDPNLQFRAARYVLDDKKGRLDMGMQLKHVNVNVVTFNEQMSKALKAAQRTIDIKSSLLPST